MDAATPDNPALPPHNLDATEASPHQEHDDSMQSPDTPPVSIVARRRIGKANAFGSPIRRSPRLSSLLPPQPPVGCHDARNIDETGDDDSASIDDVVFHLSREDTPENDCIILDEPSTVLAGRIMRAQDNPSPPPQDLAHLDIDDAAEQDDHLLPGLSASPSLFRRINILERLNQLSFPPSEPFRSPRTADKPEVSEPSLDPPSGDGSHESNVAAVPTQSALHEDLVPVDTSLPLNAQYTVDDISSQAPQRAGEPVHCENDLPSEHGTGLYVQSMPSHLDPEVPGSSSTQAIDPSSSSVAPHTPDDRPQDSLPRSEYHDRHESSHLTPIVRTPSPSLSLHENGHPPLTTGTAIPCEQDSDTKEILFSDNSGLSVSEDQHHDECSTGSTDVTTGSQQRLGSLSPRSTSVLDGLCLPSESSIEKTMVSADFEHLSSTPPRTPGPSVTHPNFSQITSVQRPIVAPTPVRVNGPGKMNSPAKFSFAVDDVHRTPARRVPIETTTTRGTPSSQRSIQLPGGSDQLQSGRFSITRTPVFTRPALDDPSRSPAKRIPITEWSVSPSRRYQAPTSPARLTPRARSASVEPRPTRPVSSRSRSVELGAAISKPDYHGKTKESIFPLASVLPRSGNKLPFPLVPGPKLGNCLPLSIPEEVETAEGEGTKTDVTLGGVVQETRVSQLRQPSASSRIPRIGNKPYARSGRPNGKSPISESTRNMAGVPKVPPFQRARVKHSVGNNNVDGPSTKSADDRHPAGSLKRKRAGEMTVSSNSHPVMIRQVVPGILSGKYAPKSAKLASRAQTPLGSSPPKVSQPLKFRKVVDGMLSGRHASVKANFTQTEASASTSLPDSPLSELSSSSSEGPSDEKPPFSINPPTLPTNETSDTSRKNGDTRVEPAVYMHPSLHQDLGHDNPSNGPRRTSRTRKPAQQQYVLDVFNGTTSTRPPPGRRKPPTRVDVETFMGMSANALKALTASNTTKNQQTVAVLATEVIRKEGLRPESPTVKARTILQKQQDERDMRRRERSQRKAQLTEGLSVNCDTQGQAELGDQALTGPLADHDGSDETMPRTHRRGPGDEEDYETPERPERVIEPLRLEGVDKIVKSTKQVKWHRGLSTAVFVNEVEPRPKSLPKEPVARGCLARTSKNLPLDHLGNLVNIENRPFPDLITEEIIVKKYLYDNDIEPEPVPTPVKMTRSKSKKKS